MAGPAAAADGALGEPRLDVRLDLAQVRRRDQRARSRRASSNGPPSRIGSARRDQLVDEPVVQLVLDQQPRTGRADLPGVQEHRGERVVDRRLEVGVGEDDVGVLAAQLERDLLHRAARPWP